MMSGLTTEYIETIKRNVEVGKSVMWEDYPESYCSDKAQLRRHEATVIAKYPHICMTDKGAVQWSLIASCVWRFEQNGHSRRTTRLDTGVQESM